MPFALAEAFVNIGIQGQQAVDSGLNQIKSSCEKLQKGFTDLSAYARRALIGIVAVGTYAAKAFGDAEQSENNLKAALAATGQEVDDNLAHMKSYAAGMQTLTGISKEQIMALQEQATNLGITAGQMDEVTKAAIGLGTALFHGDIEEGFNVLNKAKNGNFRELARKLPQLKDPNLTQEQRWDIVMKISTQGWDEAQAKTKTFYGQLNSLHQSFKTAAEGIGALLVPQLSKLSQMLQGVAIWLQHLTPAQKEQVVKWAEIAAGILAMLVLGPKIVSFGSTILSTFTNMVSGITSLIAFLVTNPIGWLLGGLAAVAVGFAYLAGSGDTMAGRLIDGFNKIIGFLDVMLGSWEGFKAGALIIWDALKYEMLDMWLGLQSKLSSMWSEMAEGFKAAWYIMADVVAEWAVQVWGTIKQLGNSIANYWDKMIDFISGKFAGMMIKHQASKDVAEMYGNGKVIGDNEINHMAVEQQIAQRPALMQQAKDNVSVAHPDLTGKAKDAAVDGEFNRLSQEYVATLKAKLSAQYKGRALSEDELAAFQQKEIDARIAQQRQVEDATGRAKAKEFNEAQDAFDKQVGDRRKAIKDWADKGMTGAVDQNTKRQQEIKTQQEQNKKEMEGRKAGLENEVNDFEKNNPKLSDKVKGVYEAIKKSLGLDGFDFAKAIQGQKDKAAGLVGKGGPGGIQHNGGPEKVQLSSVEDTMKRNLAAALLGKAAADPAKIAQQHLAAAKAANQLLKAVEKAVKDLPDGIGAFLGRVL